jgi:protein-S-isoprenylcysteine O-methyltransferase Ste14
VSYEGVLRGLSLFAIVPGCATFYFFVFWRWFEYWRKHRLLTYVFMLGTFWGTGVAAYLLRDFLLAPRISLPAWARGVGWALVATACVLGTVADRQIGIRVRSFAPFFDPHGKIVLETRWAYGVVRHPIYAAGIWFQLGAFLAGGHLAVAAACALLIAGATWFTRQEERRLVELLVDPGEYARYRARVPALFPFLR